MTQKTKKAEWEGFVEEIRRKALSDYRELFGGLKLVPKKKFDRLGNFRKGKVV